MNYNNYQQPYGGGGYAPYPYNPQQYQQINNGYNQQQLSNNLNNYNSYQPKQNIQPPRTMCEFIPVSNINEVTSYIMQPNSTVIFKDVTNKVLYEKRIDSQGISEIKAYHETSMDSNNSNGDFIKRNELSEMQEKFDRQIEEIRRLIETKKNNKGE